MYRVELKEHNKVKVAGSCAGVPNVPCGVESLTSDADGRQTLRSVPNVPCGVERVVCRK